MSATPDLSPTAQGEYTVDEVARMTGTTVRTIRWYQSEGLLPSPRRSGRVAIYDAEHVARLESIRDLQAHGLTLTAIRRLLDRAPGSAAPTALAFIKTAVAQSVGDSAEVVTEDEAAARLGLAPGARADAAVIEDLGIARVLPDGRWQIVAPAAFEAASELARLGVPLETRVEISRVLHEHTSAMAQAIVAMFVEYLWRPSEMSATEDPQTWAALAEAVTRLRPLAATSVASLFDAALAQAAEAATVRELDSCDERVGRSGPPAPHHPGR
ncbi:MAG TPA: MerR family transcriptional regulator [Acidimicrobiales bacterium]